MTKMTLRRPSGTADLEALFRNVEREAGIPAAADERIEPGQAVFRGMVLDLASIAARVASSPHVVHIYADVLRIPAGTSWMIRDRALLIAARRIEAGRDVELAVDCRDGEESRLMLFADEIPTPFFCVAVTPKGPVDVPIHVAPGGGVEIFSRGPEAHHGSLAYASVMPGRTGSDLERALATQGLVASLIHDTNSELAASMARWVHAWASASPLLRNLSLRSASLLGQIESRLYAKKHGGAFVPYLSRAVYSDQVANFARDVRQYENDYRQLATQKAVSQQGLELARRMARQQVHQSTYVESLIAQAKANFDHALAAVEASEATMRSAQRRLSATEAEFRHIGVEAWKTARIRSALIDVATAAFTFGVGVVGSIAGGGAGAGTAASGAVQTVNAVAAAAADDPFAEGARKMAARMSRLTKALAVAGKTVQLVYRLASAGHRLNGAEAFIRDARGIDLRADGNATRSDWELYRLEALETLAEPLEKEVGFARELTLAIETVAVHGQAAVTARTAAFDAAQRYVHVLLQRDLAARQQAELEQSIERLATSDAQIAAVLQELLQRHCDAKSWLLAALQDYRESYAYWALRPSSIEPRLLDPIDTIRKGLSDLTAMTLDHKSALERFSPPPQPLVSRSIVIDDAAVIASLRSEGRAAWTVSLDTPALAGLDRVRLNRVRIWLEGARPGPADTISMKVSNDGTYADRLGRDTHRFVAQPLQRKFEYRLSPRRNGSDWKFEDGRHAKVEIDGGVDREVSYAYFEPTAFSRWEVHVARENGTDLSAVTKVTMELSGSVISQ